MPPDQNKFLADIQQNSFVVGADLEKWGIVGDPLCPNWPKVIIWVRAAPKANHPDMYYFKFDLTNYPASPPTACIWNLEGDVALVMDKRPSGPKLVTAVFRSTYEQGNCLYCPCDRTAQRNHDNWKTVHPDLWWNSTFTILVYLKYIYSLLNSNDYAKS